MVESDNESDDLILNEESDEEIVTSSQSKSSQKSEDFTRVFEFNDILSDLFWNNSLTTYENFPPKVNEEISNEFFDLIYLR